MDKALVTLKYKGYTGTAEISFEDNCLCGHVVMVRDLVTYIGENPSDLEKNFREALDEYLEFCEEVGKTPDKPCSGTFNVRIGSSLHKSAVLSAAELGVSLNEFVKMSISNELAGHGRVEKVEHFHTVTHEFIYDASTVWTQFRTKTVEYDPSTPWKGEGNWPAILPIEKACI